MSEREILPEQVPKVRKNDPFTLSLEQLGGIYEEQKRQSERSKKRTHGPQTQDKPDKRYRPKPKSLSRGRNKETLHKQKAKGTQNRRIRRNSPSEAPSRRNRRERSRSQIRHTRSSSRATISANHEFAPSREERKAIDLMILEISEAIRDRAEFSKFDNRSVANTALILIRFGLDTFTELKTTRVDQRNHFIADAKKSYGFKSLKLLHELFALFPPIKRGRNIAAIEFNEVHLPRRLANFTANLSSLAGTLRPVQEMVNAVSEEIARGGGQPPTISALYRSELIGTPLASPFHRSCERSHGLESQEQGRS